MGEQQPDVAQSSDRREPFLAFSNLRTATVQSQSHLSPAHHRYPSCTRQPHCSLLVFPLQIVSSALVHQAHQPPCCHLTPVSVPLCLFPPSSSSPSDDSSTHEGRGHRAARVLRHLHRRLPRRPHRHGPLLLRPPQDLRQLPRPLHRREGHHQHRHTAELQGLLFPPCHPRLHDTGRRLHEGGWHRRGVHLRGEVRGRSIPLRTRRAHAAVHGQRGQRHQRITGTTPHTHHPAPCHSPHPPPHTLPPVLTHHLLPPISL